MLLIKKVINKLKVEDVFVSISAKYNGRTTEGITIDNNASIAVTGTTETGVEKQITGWEVINPSALVPEETSNFSISYKGLTCNLQITCTSLKPMSIGQSNAYKKAQSYLISSSFSRSSLLKQLKYEDFSQEQAEYGVAAVGY